MFFFIRCAVVLFVLAHSLAAAWRVSSPDESVRLTFSLKADGTPLYQIEHQGKPTVLPSRLGFTQKNGADLLDGFEQVTFSEHRHTATWKPLYGERSEIPDGYQEMRLTLRQKTSGQTLTLVGRAYNEGAAIRYEFEPTVGNTSGTLSAERTEFIFPQGSFGYEEYGPEGEYHRTLISNIKAKCERPLTVELADGRFACLVEADLDRYPRMLLAPSPFTEGGLISALSGEVEYAGRLTSPWRAFIVGNRPGDLLERNYLVLNLNAPNALADTSWIKPGKAIREVTLSTAGGKACIDFAAARGLSYVLYDAGWYGHEYDDASDARSVNVDPKKVAKTGELDLHEVIAYGKSKGIGIFLYVNRRALEKQRDELFPLYQSWGVAGVKFGFVNVGPQAWTTWVLDSVRKAAAHRLMVDIHDSYRPTGFTRTFPNLLTQEGVRGNEHMPTATHNATLPFVRSPAGPADYTICVYSPRIKPTRAHQLALAVVMYSPLQLLYWYDQPSAYQGEPEIEFLDRTPTVWDETRVLEGKIGEVASIARRSGRDWFVGTIASDHAQQIALSLSFLPEGVTYVAKIFENGTTPSETRIRTENVTSRSTLKAALPSAGGQAIWLTPEYVGRAVSPTGEPTNAAESAAAQAAKDREVEAAFEAWKNQRSAAEQRWLATLETYLGSYYLPRYKQEKLAGKVSPFDFVSDDPTLPNVLLIGDSVSNGYTLPTRAALAGKANVYRAPENCGPTANGVRKLDAWLGDRRWDVIHVNFGIHDRSTPQADYEQRLDQIMTRLAQTGAKVIWASTTPIPRDDTKKQDPASIVALNEIGARLAKKHGFIINDLYAWINPEIDRYQRFNDVHFTPAGYQRLAQRVSNALWTALPGSSKINTAIVPTGKIEVDSYLWEDRHAAALAIKGSLNPDIVMIGDSITHFWGGQPEDPKKNRGKESWDTLFAGHRALNLGFGWDRTQNVLKRIELGALDGIDPRLVVLNVGTNNTSGTAYARASTPAEIADGASKICEQIRAKCPRARIVVMAVFPRGQSASDPRRAVLADVNERLAQVARQQHATFLDFKERWLQPDGSLSKEMMNDFVHPTAAGYRLWAEMLKPYLPPRD